MQVPSWTRLTNPTHYKDHEVLKWTSNSKTNHSSKYSCQIQNNHGFASLSGPVRASPLCPMPPPLPRNANISPHPTPGKAGQFPVNRWNLFKKEFIGHKDHCMHLLCASFGVKKQRNGKKKESSLKCVPDPFKKDWKSIDPHRLQQTKHSTFQPGKYGVFLHAGDTPLLSIFLESIFF